jgi:hypothetical protein
MDGYGEDAEHDAFIGTSIKLKNLSSADRHVWAQ